MSEVSSTPSLAYPGAPANTPATQSLAGDMGDMSMAADIDVASNRLFHASSTSTGNGNEEPFKEGKAHLRPQLFRSPTPKRPMRKHEILNKYVLGEAATAAGEEDRSATPTHLSSVTKAASSRIPPPLQPPTATFEYSAWSSVAEEDTQRALKRMAMLAHDEYVKDPRRSVQEYYSMRLAKLIEEAEIAFDAAHLQ